MKRFEVGKNDQMQGIIDSQSAQHKQSQGKKIAHVGNEVKLCLFDKSSILSALDSKQRRECHVAISCDNTKQQTIQPKVENGTDKGTTLFTDECSAYNYVGL